MIYALLFGCNFLINIDHGTLPAATLNLKSDLGLDNVALGFLGSIVFLGLTLGKFILIKTRPIIGSLVATPIFCYLKAKHILAFSYLLNGVSLVLFTLTSDFFLLSLSRFLVGFCQVSTMIHITFQKDLYLHLFPGVGGYICDTGAQNFDAFFTIIGTTTRSGHWVYSHCSVHRLTKLEVGILYAGCVGCNAVLTGFDSY